MTRDRLTISVLVPTRNRRESLERALTALANQRRQPDEVLVVDASDRPVDEETIRADYPGLAITCIHMPPGLCAQRNAGIRRAHGSHVLLCDDDIEPPPDYLARLADHLDTHPATGAASGMVCEPDDTGSFVMGFRTPSLRHLLFASVFQLTVWADVEGARGWLAAPLKRWYRRRGNRWTLAGWPLVTQVRGPVIHTRIYGLGAALVRRDWLLASPYDERLGAHGIGDNYGVALGFPEQPGIAVLTDLSVLHHRAAENRLRDSDTYFERLLALDYFTRRSGRFPRASSLWLAWSLVGNMLVFGARGRSALLARTWRAFVLVVTGRNPLLSKRVGA